LLAGLLIATCCLLYHQHFSHKRETEEERKNIKDIAELNARLDIMRGSMYSYSYGMVDSEPDDIFREEMSKYGIIPGHLGCQIFATDYTLGYNRIIRQHLVCKHGTDPIRDFAELHKPNPTINQ